MLSNGFRNLRGCSREAANEPFLFLITLAGEVTGKVLGKMLWIMFPAGISSASNQRALQKPPNSQPLYRTQSCQAGICFLGRFRDVGAIISNCPRRARCVRPWQVRLLSSSTRNTRLGEGRTANEYVDRLLGGFQCFGWLVHLQKQGRLYRPRPGFIDRLLRIEG